MTTHVDYTATFAPPHNEPIADGVVRYRIELEPSLKYGDFETSLKGTALGVQNWQKSSIIGHGIPEAWENTDWSVREWRYTLTHKATYWLNPKIGLYSEYYMPLDRHSWRGHGQETEYYWLIGIRGRLF